MTKTRSSLLLGACLVSITSLSVSAFYQARGAAPGFVVQHAWIGKGQWMRADTHIHTRASDGGQTIAAIAARAREHGCDAIAITDHGDRKLRAATPQYMADIAAARAANPEMPIMAGLEWNVPPAGGEEHVSVLVPQASSEGEVLEEFKRRWDDYEREVPASVRAEDALLWLAEATKANPTRPVLLYNHPSRVDKSSLTNVDDLLRWRKTNDLVVGFEGAPGHQGKPPIGSYKGAEQPIDRWDPVVARPGDAWDRILGQGQHVHGAVASSDFHNDNPKSLNDFWPCQFAETWHYVPERSVNGLLRAMRAGTFFGAHGRIVRQLEITASANRLPRPAAAGETIRVAPGATVTVTVSLDVPPTDWAGQPNLVDSVEIIVATAEGVKTRAYAVAAGPSATVSDQVVAEGGGFAVRARVRRVQEGPDLMAYTNAIRVATDSPR